MHPSASPPLRNPYSPPPDIQLDVVHLDAHVLVVNKPSGLLSVPGRSEGMDDCLASRVQARYPAALVVHRLDEDTSGLVLFALSADIQRALSQAFASRDVDKGYVACVHGLLEPEAGEITAAIGRDWAMRPLRRVDTVRGQAAYTRWRVLARDPVSRTSRVELRPLTGRTHQLRLHLQHIGHPIVGDRLYGQGNETVRLMLHASELSFAHPITGKRLQLQRPASF